MSRIGDSSQLDLISQLAGFLRDNTPRRPVQARITRVGLVAVNVVLTETGTKLKNIPVSEGTAGLQEGGDIYLLYLEGNRIIAVRASQLVL